MSEKKTYSRSETVRQRRRDRTKLTSQKSRARGKRGYRTLPPITARGVVNDFAIKRRKKAGKRRFNAALSMTAARTLSLPQVHIHVGWRLLSFFLALLFGTGLYLFWTLPHFRVSTAQVTGNQRIPANEINSSLGLTGRPVFLLEPDKIREQALQAYPELASVEVSVDLPNIVTVNVVERQPLIQWQQDGIYTWVDERGVAFRPRGEAPGLIIVQALATPPALAAPEDDPLAPAPFITKEMVEALEALAPYVPPGTPILYDSVTGLSWNDARGWQAVFGFSSKDVATKALVYQAMVEWLTQRGVRPVLINVAYPDAPFYRLQPVEVQAKEQ